MSLGGATKAELESIEEEEIYLPYKFPGISHFTVNKKYFYISSSFSSRSNSYKRVELFFFLIKFFDLNNYKAAKVLKSFLPSIYAERKNFPFEFLNKNFELFAEFLEKKVFNVIHEETLKVKSKILSAVEQNYGLLTPLEGYHDVIPDEEIYSFLNALDINFCSEVPSRIRVDLDTYFSESFLGALLQELENLDLMENPFQAPIEDSITDYKKYLLSLYGSGKWDYTNLEIENLDLSIEELVCLHIILCDDLGFLTLDLELNEKPKFFSTEFPGKHGLYDETRHVPYQYFWCRLKEVIKKVNE